MKRTWTLSKRNVTTLSLFFLLFFIIFQLWNYYNIVGTTSFERTTTVHDGFTTQERQYMRQLRTSNKRQRKKSSLSNIFIEKEISNSFWVKIEQSVIMNYSKEFNYTSSEVHPLFKHLYQPNKEGMFTCFQTGQTKIDNSKINDDYCDCTDGSDEPSTSACSNGRFYCKFQTSFDDLMWVPSSRVNDGVCDCIDGSDETRSLKDSNWKRCDDLTQDMRKREKEMLHKHSDGLKIKNNWISELSLNGKAPHNKLYGHKDEFYKIKTSPCWIMKKSKYNYKICPFGESTQEKHFEKTVIGREPKWFIYNPETPKIMRKNLSSKNYVLQSSGGDASNCPNNSKRKTMIIFSCGIENKVLDISEKELCVYEVQFESPAAC